MVSSVRFMMNEFLPFPRRSIAILFGLVLAIALAPYHATAQERGWKVTKWSGAVTWTTAAGQIAKSLDGAVIGPGDRLATGANGRVMMVRGQDTLVMSENSSLQVPLAEMTGSTPTIVQIRGRVSYDVDPRPVQHFIVETPHLAAVVKGTQFLVSAEATASTVRVTRGLVEVADLRSGELAPIGANQEASASSTGRAGLSVAGEGALPLVRQGPVRQATAGGAERSIRQADKSQNEQGNEGQSDSSTPLGTAAGGSGGAAAIPLPVERHTSLIRRIGARLGVYPPEPAERPQRRPVLRAAVRRLCRLHRHGVRHVARTASHRGGEQAQPRPEPLTGPRTRITMPASRLPSSPRAEANSSRVHAAPTARSILRTVSIWSLTAIIMASVVNGAVTWLGGWSAFNHALYDARFAMSERRATDELAMVDIDERSIAAVGVWPWPRTIHATIVEKLTEGGAAAIAFDIDFSSASTEANDAALEAALARAGGGVILAAERQRLSASSPEMGLIAPLPRFDKHSWAALVDVKLEDGVVRWVPYAGAFGRELIPSMTAVLAGRPSPPDGKVAIDYTINPGTIDRISVIDLIEGRVQRSRIEGRKIIIGASAVSLKDYFVVPKFGAIPGALLQALAVDTLLQQRAIQHVESGYVILGMVVITLFGVLLLPRVNLAILLAFFRGDVRGHRARGRLPAGPSLTLARFGRMAPCPAHPGSACRCPRDHTAPGPVAPRQVGTAPRPGDSRPGLPGQRRRHRRVGRLRPHTGHQPGRPHAVEQGSERGLGGQARRRRPAGNPGSSDAARGGRFGNHRMQHHPSPREPWPRWAATRTKRSSNTRSRNSPSRRTARTSQTGRRPA
jgi:CHASE2 domain-containing sensor protein